MKSFLEQAHGYKVIKHIVGAIYIFG